jgi:hypothetical protein
MKNSIKDFLQRKKEEIRNQDLTELMATKPGFNPQTTDILDKESMAQIQIIDEIEKSCATEIELADLFDSLSKGIEKILNISTANAGSSDLTIALQEAIGILGPIPQKIASIELELSQKNLMEKAVDNIKTIESIPKQSLLDFVEFYTEDNPDNSCSDLANSLEDWIKSMQVSSSSAKKNSTVSTTKTYDIDDDDDEEMDEELYEENYNEMKDYE